MDLELEPPSPKPMLQTEQMPSIPKPPAAIRSNSQASTSGSEAESGESDPIKEFQVQTGNIEGGANIADQIQINNNNYHSAGQERSRLSPQFFRIYSIQDLERERGELIFSTISLEPLAQRLREQRLLFLIGAPEAGKGTFARLLAHSLCNEGVSEVLFYPHPLPRSMEMPFGEMASNSKEYGRRALIFKDSWHEQNLDLLRFLHELDNTEVARYANLLKENNSFWLFTADNDHIEAPEKLSSLGLLAEVPSLAIDQLSFGLRLKVDQLLRARPDAEGLRGRLESLVDGEAKTIVSRLGSMPRITRFVQEWLMRVAKESLSLEEALERVDDLEQWILQGLPEEFDTWCYVLALVMCSAASTRIEKVSWIRFHQFRRALERILSRELRRSVTDRSARWLCSEEDIRREAAVEIDAGGGVNACTIRFREDFYPQRLWKSLLGPGRQILGLLIKPLRELLHSPEPLLRLTAAQVLGRIGELDPYGITMPLIWNPPGEDDVRRSEMMGQLIRGAHGSEAVNYRSLCLREVRSLLSAQNIQTACGAILALREMGIDDLDLALNGIHHALSSRFSRKFKDLGPLHRLLQVIEAAAKEKPDVRNTLRSIQVGDFRPLFSNAEQKLLEAINTTLGDLCLQHDSMMELIDQLSLWCQDQDDALARLTILMVLGWDGLMENLDRFRVDIAEGDFENQQKECSVILYWAWRIGPRAVQQLASFIETIYLGTAPFPAVLRQALRKRWLRLLKGWARQACAIGPSRTAVVGLFDRLISTSSNPEVRQEILHLLKFDPEFAEQGSDLEAIAIEIITRTPPEPRSTASLAITS